MRYIITVTQGHKVVYRQGFVTYEKALEALDRIETRYSSDHYAIDFKDNQPFGWGWGSAGG